MQNKGKGPLRFESETKEEPASSQVDPKAKKRRYYRQYSKQVKPSERLQSEETSFGESSPRMEQDTPHINKSKLRIETAEAKRDKAHQKLDAQKAPKNANPVKIASKAAVSQAWYAAHNKIHEAEDENTGVDAAHRIEILGEKAVGSSVRFAKHRARTHPVRQVQKLEKRSMSSKADYEFRKQAQEHPELKSNTVSRYLQKRKLKKQYAKQARETAKHGAKAAEKTAVTTEKLARAAFIVVKRHPVGTIIVILVLAIVLLVSSVMSSFSVVGEGIAGAIVGTSYLAEDADIDMAELAYTEWETNLELEILNVESIRSGYDEYRYSISEISHNPYVLMAFLTAVYDDFTYSDVEPTLQSIFNEQYSLTYDEEMEIRYLTVTHTDPDTGESYTEQVAYEWRILNVTLISRPLTSVVSLKMDSEQLERYNIYMTLKGNRQYLASPFGDTNWLPHVSSYYGYRVHPISGEKNYHKGVDIGMPTGTEILAGQDGIVTTASYDSGYGYYIVLDDGAGLVSKYAHCSVLLVSAGQTVKTGDVIAKVGSTGNSTGSHLHLEIIKDGQYLNPLYFAITNDYEQGPSFGYPGEPMGDGSYAALIREAEKYLGYPYVWGGSSPSTSFDCSGFVCWVLNQSGVASVGRTTAQGLYNMCTPVSAANAKPGDLIFFTGTYKTSDTCTHVGIYVGNGMMIHCGNPIQYASINTTYWQNHFYAFGRIT